MQARVSDVLRGALVVALLGAHAAGAAEPATLATRPVPFPSSPTWVEAANADVRDVPAPGRPSTWSVAELLYGQRDVAPAPDGERLAFVRGRPAVMSVTTGEILAEMPDGGDCRRPAWSADGRTVAVWCALPRMHDSGDQSGFSASDGHELVFWDVLDGTRRSGGHVDGDTASLTWVAPRRAWWVTAPQHSGVLGTWIELDGRHVEEPAPPSVNIGRNDSPQLAWSIDGTRAWCLVGKTLVPLSWIDGRLVTGAPAPVVQDSVRDLALADDGRVWLGGDYGAQQVLSPTGAVQWRASEDEQVHPVWKAVFLATGQCPAVPEHGIGNYGRRLASPDGRWTAHEQWIDIVLDGSTRALPAEPFASPAKVHAEIGPGRWLVTLHGTPAILDLATGRFTWALEGTHVLAAHGAAVLLSVIKPSRRGWTYHATPPSPTLLGIDFATGRAWRATTSGVHPDGGGAWVRDVDGTLRRVRADGMVSDEVEVGLRPVGIGTGITRFGWTPWRYQGGWVVTFEGGPGNVRSLGPDQPSFGLDYQPSWGGGAYVVPAMGWIDDDGVHVLDDQGHQHRLAWEDGLIENEDAAPSEARVSGWLRRARAGELSVVAIDQDAVENEVRYEAPSHAPRDSEDTPLVIDPRANVGRLRLWISGNDAATVDWSLPHPLDAATRERRPPVGWPELRSLSGGGWVLFRPDGSAAGKDLLGTVILTDTATGTRTTPIALTRSWTAPPPVELGRCPWDGP